MQDSSNNLARAVRFHQVGRLQEAERIYLQILKENPNHIDALHLQGVIAHQVGKNDMAVALISKAISINSSYPHFHNNLGNALKAQGKIEDAVKCFQEALRLKPDYPEAHNNMGNSLKEQGQLDKAIECYQKAIELKPDYAEAHNNIGNTLKEKGDRDGAIRHFQKAIQLKSNFAEAYHNIGNIFGDQGDLDAAVEHYKKALRLRPDFAEAHNNLGNVLKEQGKLEAAIEHYKTALQIKPDYDKGHYNLGSVLGEQNRIDEAMEHYQMALQKHVSAEAHNNLGNALKGQGKFDEAIEHYDKAIKIKPESAEAHYNRGMALLVLGRFAEGWPEYEWRFKSKEVLKQIGNRVFSQPRWDGSPLSGRTILVHSEQGIGDAIQFIRYIPLVKANGGRVIFECQKELMTLINGFPGIDLLIERSDSDEIMEAFDVYIPLLSLPGIFDATINTISAETPYLKANHGLVEKMRGQFDTKSFNVGLAWAGNPAHKNDRNRSCKLSDFAQLSSISGLTLFSLQKGTGSDQAKNPPEGMTIINLEEELKDFAHTAAAIDNLDLIISVDTSVVHLAGAMGKPVWTLLPFDPDWRWMLEREDTPWYPTMRLFRQGKFGNWNSVMANVVKELNNLLGKSNNTCKEDESQMEGESKGAKKDEIFLVMPRGVTFGWGVCGRYIAHELDKIANLRYVTEPFEIKNIWDPDQFAILSRCFLSLEKLNGLSDADGRICINAPVIQAIQGANFRPWLTAVRGFITVGYTFFEDNILSEDNIRWAKDYYDLIAAGSTWCEDVLKSYGFSRTKVILQGIDHVIFHSAGKKETDLDTFRIFSGGKFEFRKGQDIVLKAVKVMQERYKDVYLVTSWYNQWSETMNSMAASPYIKFEMPCHQMGSRQTGSDECQNTISHILSINGIDTRRVICLPPLPNNQMPEIYRNTDIGIFPNRCEGGTNLVLMEYMACGRPVIASYLTGHKDVLDQKYAILINGNGIIDIKRGGQVTARWEEPDLDEVISRLDWAYHHRDTIRKMGEDAAIAMLRFTWNETAQSFYNLVSNG